jgi:hypothetical protein
MSSKRIRAAERRWPDITVRARLAKHPKNYDDLVWVQCKGYRCLAFRDASGRWINFYNGQLLTDFIERLY